MNHKYGALKNQLCCMVLFMSTANAADAPLKIRSVFDINSAYCAIKTNGVLGMDNRDSAVAGRGFGTASTNSLLLLENGENDITVEIGALGWFSNEKLTDKERKTFNPESSCKVELTAFKGEQTKVLNHIKITINESGIPIATLGDGKNSSPSGTLMAKRSLAQQATNGHFPSKYLIENYFPNNMEIYQFTQKVHLQGLPEWKWSHAVPFTGKPEQVLNLKQAYLHLWSLLNAKDIAGTKSYLNESLQSWAITTGESIDDIYNDNDFVSDFKNPKFSMIPINWDDYEIESFNKNRMVRFINKSDPSFSPLNYYIRNESGNEGIRGFAPIFSFIDGKFVPVI